MPCPTPYDTHTTATPFVKLNRLVVQKVADASRRPRAGSLRWPLARPNRGKYASR